MYCNSGVNDDYKVAYKIIVQNQFCFCFQYCKEHTRNCQDIDFRLNDIFKIAFYYNNFTIEFDASRKLFTTLNLKMLY